MIKSFISMLKNDDGASLVEYALLIALVAGAAIAGLHALGGTLNATGTDASKMIQSGNALLT
jgi:Flp pilus assembly pilin Flp